jgi:murein DD-endopeptidase MepM/ murein hydrolase activator NlpD
MLLIGASPPPQKATKPSPSLSDALKEADQANAFRAMKIGLFSLNRRPEQGALALGHVPLGTTRLVVDGREVRFAADGLFAIGFGRDYAASALITAFLGDGRNVSERLPVARHQWDVSNLTTVLHHPMGDADFQARRPAELAQIATGRPVNGPSLGWRQQFFWPVHGPITTHFGAERIYSGVSGGPHSGVDVGVPQGTPVYAPADGIVTLAADHPFTLEGNLLMMDHGLSVNSAFLHLSRIIVHRGDLVHQGQLIGYSGMTGRASGPHLHWGMKWMDEKIDPMSLTGAMRQATRKSDASAS